MAGADSSLIACPSCDMLFETDGLSHGEKAYCSRCGHFLTEVRNDGFERVLVFSLSGMICLVMACSFPFLSFKSSGLESVMTLPETAWSLYEQGMPDLALLVAAFIIGIPAIVLVLLFALSTCMVKGLYFDWMAPVTRLMFHLQNWSMVEVFFIGVLVSLVKIGHMATVVMGISFWGYSAFAILFVLSMSSLDRFQYWSRLEQMSEAAYAS